MTPAPLLLLLPLLLAASASAAPLTALSVEWATAAGRELLAEELLDADDISSAVCYYTDAEGCLGAWRDFNATTVYASTANLADLTLAVGDLNSDGLEDFVGVASLAGSTRFLVWLGTGASAWEAQSPAVSAALFPSAPGAQAGVAVTDVDADGFDDVVVCDAAPPRVLLGSVNGTFSEASSTPFDGLDLGSLSGEACGVALADLSGDGLDDLFLSPRSGDTLMFKGQAADEGQGLAFAVNATSNSATEALSYTPSNAAILTHPPSLNFLDFDNDSDLDAIYCTADGSVSVFVNQGSSSVPILQESYAPASPAAIPAAAEQAVAPVYHDVTGDGFADLVLATYSGAIGVYESIQLAAIPSFALNADGFKTVLLSDLISAGFDASAAHNTTVAFGDLDNDGDDDALIGSSAVGVAYFEHIDPSNPLAFEFKGEGDAVDPFAASRDELAGLHHCTPALGDLDSDGDLDLLVGTSGGAVLFFRNNGTKEEAFFVLDDEHNPLASSIPSIVTFSAPFIVDFTEDGLLDVVIGTASSVFTLKNTGTATEPVMTGNGAAGLTQLGLGVRNKIGLKDMDDDGDLDAYRGRADGSVAVFENTGSTVSPVYVELEEETTDVGSESAPGVADLNGDGVLDIAAFSELGTLHFAAGYICASSCGGRGICRQDTGTCDCLSEFTGSECNQCAAGYYGESCSACPGSTGPCNFRGTCDDGLAGTGVCTCVDATTSSCSGTCELGTALDTNTTSGLLECLPCQPGTYRSDESSSKCTRCPINANSNVNGTDCECYEGFYMDSTPNSKLCRACPDYGTSEVGSTSVDQCWCPEHSSANNGTSCDCDDGYRRNEDDDCVLCDAGTYLLTESGNCELCGETEWSVDGAIDSCNACPEHGVNCENGFLLLEDGYWYDSAMYPPTSAVTFYDCPAPSQCIANQTSLTIECAPGSKGILCGVCEGNYELQGDNCTECWSPVTNWLFVCVSIIMLGMMSGYLVHRQVHSKFRKAPLDSQIMRIFLNFVFVLGSLGEFRARGPETFRELVSWTESSTGFTLSVLPVRCAFGWDFYERFYASMCFPLLLLVVPAIIVYITRVYRHILGALNPEGADPDINFMNIFSKASYQATVEFLLFLMYNTLVKTLLQAFDCVEVNGTRYLEADLSTACEGGSYYLMVALSSLLVMIYLAGIPALALFYISKHKDSLSDRKIHQRLGFVYDGYKAERYPWWEVVVLGRKVGVIFVTVFENDAFLQVFYGITLISIALLLQLMHMPYENPLCNRLEIFSLVVSYVTQTSTLLYFKDLVDDILITAVLTLVNVGAVCVFIYFFASEKRRQYVVTHPKLTGGPRHHKGPGIAMTTLTSVKDRVRGAMAGAQKLEDES